MLATMGPSPSLQPQGLPQVSVHLDPTLFQLASAYLDSGSESLLDEMASTPAAAHLLTHARAWEYDVPHESRAALVKALVTPRAAKAARLPGTHRVLEAFKAMAGDNTWIAEIRRGLPTGAANEVSLFLTFGYDIGVAGPGTASLNAAHPYFQTDPRELRYYAIHECHHAVFMTYQKPRPLADWKTAADLLAQAEYALQLEGMAVWAAWELREKEGALDKDADYRALQDKPAIRRLEAAFLKAHKALQARAAEPGPADGASRSVLFDLYGPERVFYRFGAHAARQIERHKGRPALLSLVQAGPRAFLEAYLSCAGESPVMGPVTH